MSVPYTASKVGALIQRYLKRTQVSIHVVAEDAGVSVNAVRRMVSGEEVSVRTLQAVLAAIGYELVYRAKSGGK